MKLSFWHTIKLYTIPNIYFFKMYDVAYNENINSILFSNNSIQLSLFLSFLYLLFFLKERVSLISLLLIYYLINLKKISLLNSVFN
jgi:hypothetical protein